MTKNQLYALLGHPHFAEGFGKVREWDYIFNFRKSGGTEVETCQYKIIYTSSMRVRNTYWKPEVCAHWLALPEAQAQMVVEKTIEKLVPGSELIRMQLSADGMFDFDKSEITNLRPGGVEKLNRVSTDLLSGGEIVQLKVVGHTDRLGDDAYNMKLSRARADTIRQYLVAKNIPAERITTFGVGKSAPLVECKQNKRDETLIRCLAPNRRFEIEAWTVRKM
ncbi:MAG TPA: OmpA family protein [Methylotenera sp.]|nr:OmpA family protein [Methylotenera sp.]